MNQHSQDADAPGVTLSVGDPPDVVGMMLSRFEGVPLFMDATFMRRLFSSVAGFARIASLRDAEGTIAFGEQLRHTAALPGASQERSRPYRVIDGVALVPVNGSLMHKWGYLGSYSCGYDALLRWVSLAVEDSSVDGILLDIDSHGGEVAGLFDTTRTLRQLGEQKPIAALCNDRNLSAAMCIASAAERRYITQTGEAGSVGVVMAHFSYEEWDKKDGLEVTLIYSGGRKVDGNPYQNLPDDVFERFQEQVHDLRSEFAGLLADHLSLDRDAVLATEAGVFRGQAAIDVGFADEVVNGHEAIAAFRNHLSSQDRSISLGAIMNDQEEPNGAGQEDAPAAGAEDQAKAQANAVAEATQQATQDERTRVSAILNHEHAAGRAELATHLALNTDLSVEEAGAILEATPVGADPDAAGEALDRAMQTHGGKQVGADADPG